MLRSIPGDLTDKATFIGRYVMSRCSTLVSARMSTGIIIANHSLVVMRLATVMMRLVTVMMRLVTAMMRLLVVRVISPFAMPNRRNS